MGIRVLSDAADGSVNWYHFQTLLTEVWNWCKFSSKQWAFMKLIYKNTVCERRH